MLMLEEIYHIVFNSIMSVRLVISPFCKMSRSGPFITKDLTIVTIVLWDV